MADEPVKLSAEDILAKIHDVQKGYGEINELGIVSCENGQIHVRDCETLCKLATDGQVRAEFSNNRLYIYAEKNGDTFVFLP